MKKESCELSAISRQVVQLGVGVLADPSRPGQRTMGEHNIFYHTDMYVHAVQGQQTKGVRGFLEGKTGLDTAC